MIFVLTFALVAPALGLLPAATAQVGGAANAAGSATSQARSVGTFDVTPVQGAPASGKATGSVVSAIVTEAAAGATGESVVRDFKVAQGADASSAEELFSRIDIKDFSATSKLQGAGTTVMSLKGSNALLQMTDNVNSLLVIKAIGNAEQVVTLSPPSGVRIAKSTSAEGVWNVQGSAVAGAIVLVSAKGEAAARSSGSSLAVDATGKATATLKAGTQLVFRANADYGASADGAADAGVKAYNEAVVKALADASLAGEATTEFASGADLIANANYFTAASAQTESRVGSRVTTTVRGTGAIAASTASSISKGFSLAYDLDYVDVAAASASQVAVYVNGALAMRATSAAQVAENAKAGINSFHAVTTEGRVLVLASTATRDPSTVTVASIGNADFAAATLAQLDATLGVTSQVVGSFSILGDLQTSTQGSGQVVGDFNAFAVSEAKGKAKVSQYTDVRSSTEIFAAIDFAADAGAEATADVHAVASANAQAAANAQARASSKVAMATKVGANVVANAEFTDSVYAAIAAHAEAATTAHFRFAGQITATAVSEEVLRLEGPAGPVGFLILAQAKSAANVDHKWDTSVDGEARAKLAAGASVLFRSAASAKSETSAEIIAKAIAAGELASEVNVGFVANAVAGADVDWRSKIDARLAQKAESNVRGKITAEVQSQIDAATSILVEADQQALAAAKADDIIVKVDAVEATRVDTAAQVFAAARGGIQGAGGAVYFVQANVQGHTQVLTALDLKSTATSSIEIVSKLEAEAKAKAAVDTFGSFSGGYGGAVRGGIVSMVAKPEAGLLLDYAVTAKSTADATTAATTTVFNAVQVGASAFTQASSTTSNSLRFESPEANIEAYDVSSALLKITADAATTANFDLASNVKAQAVSSQVVMLSATGSDFVGALILTGAQQGGAQAQSTFTTAASAAAAADVSAQLQAGAQVIFKAFSGFEAELTQAEKTAQAEAIARGDLLGQVIVDTQSLATAKATQTATVNYFSGVQAITSVATSERVTILVDSATSTGRSIIISLDPDTVSGLLNGDAELLVDGKAIGRADSYEDVLTSAKGEADEYWIITTDAQVGLQAIVTLAHFSTREITLQTPTPPSIYLWTTVGLGAIVVAQALVPWIRRMRSKW